MLTNLIRWTVVEMKKWRYPSKGVCSVTEYSDYNHNTINANDIKWSTISGFTLMKKLLPGDDQVHNYARIMDFEIMHYHIYFLWRNEAYQKTKSNLKFRQKLPNLVYCYNMFCKISRKLQRCYLYTCKTYSTV